MRTTFDLDPELVQEVLRRTGEKNASRAINKALSEFIRRQKLDELRRLLGTMDLEDNWREMEERELEDMRRNER
jgi:Arc/MetJ family transcription regulator